MSKAAPVLRLARLTVAFGVTGNLWFVALWARAGAESVPAGSPLVDRPLWLLLGAAALGAVGLVSFGATLNDSLDATRDQSLNPLRPIPSGQVSERATGALLGSSLLLGLLGSVAFGTAGTLVAIGVAVCILALTTGVRFVPAAGLPLLAMVYAAHMFVVYPEMRFVWPAVLVLTHSFAAAAVAHAVGGKAPRISKRAWTSAVLAWAVLVGILIALGRSRTGDDRAWLGDLGLTMTMAPAVAAAVFAVVVVRKVGQVGRGPRAAEKITRYAALWLPVYGSAWLAGIGAWLPAVALALFALFGFAGASTAREAFGLIERPVAFRR